MNDECILWHGIRLCVSFFLQRMRIEDLSLWPDVQFYDSICGDSDVPTKKFEIRKILSLCNFPNDDEGLFYTYATAL
jgi:hypothetical protein